VGELDWRMVRELIAVRTRVREMVERALMPEPPSPVPGGAYECPIDIWENDRELVIEAELPGVERDGLELRLGAGTLTLVGELPGGAPCAGTPLRIERYWGRFHRTLPLPVAVHGEPRATLRAGLLEVRLPKQRPRRRRVAIGGEDP